LYESQFPGLSARVIPNGIDTTLFSPAPNKQPSAFRIVTVSRLIPRKGIDLLLSACRKIHENGFPFHCLIVGEGPEEGRLKAMAKELGIENHVQFYGRKEKLQIATLLPQCDLFVLPSYAEGMSNAALEAMACGLPLLLTETGGSQELINGNGLVVPPGDAEALGEKLLFLSANPERLKEMGGQSRNLAEAMSWKSVADAYYQVYMEAAGRS
jgi:glycosyltransferase involved in cell wall biosynthesis